MYNFLHALNMHLLMRFGLDNGKIITLILLLPIFQITALILMIFSCWCCMSLSVLNLRIENQRHMSMNICTYDVCFCTGPLSVLPSCPLLPSPSSRRVFLYQPGPAPGLFQLKPDSVVWVNFNFLADDLNGSSRSAPSVCVCLCGQGQKLPFEYLNVLARHTFSRG